MSQSVLTHFYTYFKVRRYSENGISVKGKRKIDSYPTEKVWQSAAGAKAVIDLKMVRVIVC